LNGDVIFLLRRRLTETNIQTISHFLPPFHQKEEQKKRTKESEKERKKRREKRRKKRKKG